MIELKAGVFVGTMNALVREKLWEKVTAKSKGGGCLQVFPARNEQGFSILFHGQTARKVVDMEGLQLVQTKKS